MKKLTIFLLLALAAAGLQAQNDNSKNKINDPVVNKESLKAKGVQAGKKVAGFMDRVDGAIGEAIADTSRRFRGYDRRRSRWMADQDQVDAIVALLKKENFDDRRIEIAKTCVFICPVPVEGLFQMAKTFSFDKNRLEFLEYAYDYCPDRGYYWFLREAFDFSTNADQMCKDLDLRRPSERY